MTYTLAPSLLLSMPQLQDPNFARTVVLLCEHGPEGAFGLVLNRPTDALASSVVGLTPPIARDNGIRLWIGGPVEPHRGWILMADPPVDPDSRQIRAGLYLSSSSAELRRVLEMLPSPRARVLAGYAGWGPGQLDMEMQASAWLTAEVELDLVFDVEPALMWESAIRRLGADPSLLQASHGVH
jgi:putative transcriptional regulator